MTKFISKTCILLIILAVISFRLFSQSHDLVVNVSDKMINKLLTAIGPVSGVEEYTVMMINGKCNWLVQNPVIKLDENKAWFEADVTVSTGNFSYTDRINGLIKINYNKQTDKLELRLDHVLVDIKTKILGKERLIKTIDLANYYKTPFIFDGPGSYAEEFSFEMPDGTLKKLKTVVKNCDISTSKGLIQMKANIDFIDPAKTKTAVISPKQEIPPPSSNTDEKGKKKTKKKKTKKDKEKK